MRNSPPPPSKEEFACLVDTLLAVTTTFCRFTDQLDNSSRVQAEAAIEAANIALAPYLAPKPLRHSAEIVIFPGSEL
jgi:hypothetical protein